MKRKLINIWEILTNIDCLMMKFYSPAFGDVEIEEVTGGGQICVSSKDGERTYEMDVYGRLKGGEECMLYPSRECRDWEEWRIKYYRKDNWTNINRNFGVYNLNLSCEQKDFGNNMTDRCVAALFKIIIIIEKGFGGNVTKNGTTKFYPYVDGKGNVRVSDATTLPRPFGFATADMCKRFLNIPENESLVEDYYMIETDK